MGPHSYAEYSVWDDIRKGKIQPFTTEQDWFVEVLRREKEYQEIQDPGHKRWLPVMILNNKAILRPPEFKDVLDKYYHDQLDPEERDEGFYFPKSEEDTDLGELIDRWQERGFN